MELKEEEAFVEVPLFKNLTLEEECVLKRILLSDALEDEVHRFSKSSSPYSYLLKETVLMRFLFSNILGEHPHPSVKNLVLKAPQILAIVAKASKKKDTSSSMFAIIADLLLRTPQEKTYAETTGHVDRFSELVENNINIRKIEGEDECLFDAAKTARKQIIESLVEIYQEISIRPDGINHTFSLIANAKTIAELPHHYQGIFNAMTTAIIPRVCEVIKDKSKVETRKKMYHSFPRRTLKTILSITNPFKMASSLTSFFLYKPMGARNLAQKMLEISTEFQRTTNALKDLKKEYHSKNQNQNLLDRIEEWASKEYEPLGEAFLEENRENSVDIPEESEQRKELDSVLSPSNVRSLGQANVAQLYKILQFEKRKRDKLQMIDLLGDPEMIAVLKDIVPMVLEPFGNIYGSIGVSEWVGKSFDWIKCVFHIGEKSNVSELEKKKELIKGVRQLEEAHYKLIRNIVMADKDGSIKKVICWIFQKFKMGEGYVFDVSKILRETLGKLELSQRAEVMDDLNRLIAFDHFKNHLWKQDFKLAMELQYPKHEAITKYVLPNFFLDAEKLPIVTIKDPISTSEMKKKISSDTRVPSEPKMAV